MLVLDLAAGFLDVQERRVHEEVSLVAGLQVPQFLVRGGEDFPDRFDGGFRHLERPGVPFDGARQDHGQADQGPVGPRLSQRKLPGIPVVPGAKQLFQCDFHEIPRLRSE